MEFFKKKLKNGITVLFEKRDLPIVSVSITNRFGGAYEKSEIKGIAHLIEHLVFTGTKTRTHEDISREIEKKGGILNAFTSHEVTSFWFKMPSKHLFAGLDILTDMLNNSKFDKEKFDKEKKVVLEEIKMYHDDPRRSVFDQLEKNMFEKPFGELVIGNEETISNLERDFVADFFEKAYNSENYIVTIVGEADFSKVCDYFEKNFKAGKKEQKILKIVRKNKESTEEKGNLDQAHFVFGTHTPLPSDKIYPAIEVLDAYLANGMSSRLFLEIREKRGLAYVVSSSLESEKSYGYYVIYVGTRKEAVDEVKKLILEGFREVSKMNEKDLEEAKERLIGLKKVRSEESVNVMNSLMLDELVGDARDYYEWDKKINAVKLEDVKKIAKMLVKDYSTAAIVPK